MMVSAPAVSMTSEAVSVAVGVGTSGSDWQSPSKTENNTKTAMIDFFFIFFTLFSILTSQISSDTLPFRLIVRKKGRLKCTPSKFQLINDLESHPRTVALNFREIELPSMRRDNLVLTRLVEHQ